MQKTVSILVILGAASILASLAYYKYVVPTSTANPSGTTTAVAKDDPAVRPPVSQTVTALGRLEPAGGVVQISGMVGDRLAELHVALGDEVVQDQPIAKLGSHELRHGELLLAQSQLKEARQRKEAEEKHAAALMKEADLALAMIKLQQLDIESQQEKIGLLKSTLSAAERNLARQKALSDEIVSAQEREQLELSVEQARAELTAAEKLLIKLQDSYELSLAQAEAKRETAEASRQRIPSLVQLDSLQKSVDLAQTRLEMTVIRTPSKGRILEIYSRAGETLGPQPILAMADTSRMAAVAEVYEDQALRVRPKQTAWIESSALGPRLRGDVVHVGTLVGKNQVVSLAPTASTDLRVVEVRILLDPNEVAEQLINLQVTVEIEAPEAAATAAQPVTAGTAPFAR